ncbi:Ribonuclease P/MRP protein subunit RPP15 / FY16936)) [Taphrina deformans PYCC 5710]|uniref:Ribonuclease P/MRP protein subunit RPP15 / FY16936 n=1 Tax=Taphrina deformans (strain PYCC 5710 / ATCC 11124 / CBS 356.35 / IMI 108563 / JCM 9778 / NBRC 8474) TaxID=1097556 RepID=R4X8J2_TAPDE|nr:Ribonuclease P/MRP protein subunit RPP15 / FY16936)) [Taphrina deformans PYCC 5710]|eukprot:CCG81934.1 Ribonuclease P/MRP protein subunit RPP15 / FY16936)) [Taphrina deformans PYCC 5710]
MLETNQVQTNPIDKTKLSAEHNIQVLSRITLTLEDTSINYNISSTTKDFDILAVRPTSEKTLQHACTSMDVDIISLDLSVRLPFYLKHSTLGSATSRGLFLEICYSSSLSDSTARRQLLSNASNLVRASRGRGIIISSEARSAMGLRGPYDLINLATFWGLSQERGRDTIAENARKVVVTATTRRGIHKGVLKITQQPEAKVQKRPAPDGASEQHPTMGMSKKKLKQMKKLQGQ